jgi:hypothetical protein
LNRFYKINKGLKIIFLTLFLFIYHTYSTAQLFKNPEYTVETGAIIATGKQTPFWLISNRYGLISTNKFNSWLKAGIHSSLDSTKNIGFEYGFDIVNRYAVTKVLYLHQGYGRLKLGFINIQAGKIEEKFGNQDPELSSGGILWSGNARTMPKITINVPNYTSIPLTKGYLEFKGGIAHGWFTDNEYIKNVYLHHKYIYLQAGGKLPVHIHYGFHHYAQWGGISNDPTVGKLPSGFSDFIKVFFGKGGEASTAAPWEETANSIGNHLGSENLGIDIKLKDYKINTYWQTIFEDGSGRAHRNIKDGLWGITISSRNENRWINRMVIEYIHTTDQSYRENEREQFDTTILVGPDNYFNHGFYKMGWTNQNMTLGTPLISSPVFTNGTASSPFIVNNKVKAIHCGISGKISNLSYKIVYTYSLNYGTYALPYEPTKKQHSLLTEAQMHNITPWKLNLGLAMGYDSGTMYGDNFGVQIKLIKKGNF